jgi:hypothetical protein
MSVSFNEIFNKNKYLILAAGALLASGCQAAPAAEEPATLPEPGTLAIEKPVRLTEKARIPEREEGFVGARAGAGRLEIDHDGGLRGFEVGDVLAGTADGGYLVRVVRARELNGTHVVLETEQAHLTDLIAEGSLRIHYDAADHARRLNEYVELRKATGDLEEDEGEAIGTSAQALKVGAEGTLTLLKLSHASLPASCGAHVSGSAEVDVEAKLTPALDLELDIGSKPGINPLPEVKKFRLVASGTLDVDAALHASGTVSGDCTVDLLKLAGGVPSIPLPTLTFWAGPVPIIVTTDVVPVAKAKVGLAFEAAEITAEAGLTASLEAGVEYEEKQWSTVWEPSCAGSGTATVEAPGAITAECTVSAGAELRARLYGVLGPSLGVVAHARAQAETAAPYCTYDAWIDGGVQAYAEVEAGISVGPLDLTLVELPLMDFDLVHVEGPHFSGDLRDAPECSAL